MAARTNELPADHLAATGGNLLRLWHRQTQAEATVSHDAAVQCVAWNRNNKVVATGCADGVVQLAYSSGQLMSVLRAGGAAGPLGGLAALDWSTGSKLLAAGSDNGGVYVWDLKASKGYSLLARHDSPVTSVRYHPDDRFLAAASAAGAVALYDFQGKELARLGSPDGSAKRSLEATPMEAALAAGTDAGGVLVWDWAAQQVKEHYARQHTGAVSAVSFIPLKPRMLYSVGADGKLVLQDRRAGPAYASRVEVGTPLTALSVREDYTSVAAGTADGTVLLYDPRQLATPLHRLTCVAGVPVTGLHWQHCYSSLSSRMRHATAAKSKAQHSADPAAAAPPPAAARPGAAQGTAGSCILQGAAAAAAAPQLGAGNPTYSALRRHSGIGTGAPAAGAAASRTPAQQQPSPAAGAQLPGPSPLPQQNPLFDPQTRAAQAGLAALSRGAEAASPQSGASHHAAQPPQQPAATPLQQQQLGPAFGAGGELNITPLSGMAPRRAPTGPTPGHVTPQPQRPAPTLMVPELAGAAPAPSAASPPEGTPLPPYAAAAEAQLDFAITPLSTMAGRSAFAAAAAAAPPASAVAASSMAPPPVEAASAGTDALQITPLSGMRPAAAASNGAAAAAATAAGHGVLQERTNSGSVAAQLASLRQQGQQHTLQRPPAAAQPAALQQLPPSPRLAPGLGELSPPSPDARYLASPPAVENLPSPGASLGAKKAAQQQQQQPAGAGAVNMEDSAALVGSAKAQSLPAAEPGLSEQRSLGSQGQEWYLKAAPGRLSEGAPSGTGDVAMADAGSPAAAQQQQQQEQQQGLHGSSPAVSSGFSFQAAAKQPLGPPGGSWQQGAEAGSTPSAKPGRGRGGAASPGPDGAAAGGQGGGFPLGLREDILALHLDMLNQFQVQQEQMGALVQHVLARQDALAAEVGALRRQLQDLLQRRDDVLWL